MKRLLILLVAMLLLVSPVLAEQTARLTLLDDRLLVVPSYDELYAGLFSARIQNTGALKLQMTESLFELLDKDGGVLVSNTYVAVMPNMLAPGEIGYVALYEKPDNAASADVIASHTLDIKASTNTYMDVTRLEAEGELLPPRESYDAPFLQAKVTNNTDETLYGVNVVFALWDNEGKLFYVQDTGAYSVGIPAGGTVYYGETLDSSIVDYMAANGITIQSVETIAYVDVW